MGISSVIHRHGSTLAAAVLLISISGAASLGTDGAAYANSLALPVLAEPISIAADGEPLNDQATPYWPNTNHATSDNGRFVVYDTPATNALDSPQTTSGVYMRDRQLGTTIRVDTRADGQASNGNSYQGSISGDGTKAAFNSAATNLVPAATDGRSHAYVKDLVTGALTLAELSNEGTTWPWGTTTVMLARDGNYVALCLANNGWYPPTGFPAPYYVYVRNLTTGTTRLVPSIPNTDGGVRYSHHLVDVSPDGRYVLVHVSVSHHSANPADDRPDNYVVDMNTGAIHQTQNADRLVADGSAFVVRRKAGAAAWQFEMFNYVTGETTALDLPPSGNYLPTDHVAVSGDGRTAVYVSRLGAPSYTYFLNRRNIGNGTVQQFTLLAQPPSAYYSTGIDGVQLSSDGTTAVLVALQPFGLLVPPNGDRTLPAGYANRWVTFAVPLPASPDTVAPVVTGTADREPNSAGWYNGPVTVHWSAFDPEPSSGSPTVPPPNVITDEGRDITQSSLQACDPAGNCATGYVTVSIDHSAPTIEITGAIDEAQYVIGTEPTASTLGCQATDSLSGLAGPCSGELSGGEAGGVGEFTYAASAIDLAGNRTTRTIHFRVVYGFSGFTQPLGNADTPTLLNAGRTVPIKFRLTDSEGNVVAPDDAPRWITPQRGGSTSAPSSDADFATTPSAEGACRWADSTWIYNWHTDRSQGGFYWRIGVQLSDGTVHYAVVALR